MESLSVIIPAFNRESLIGDTLKSLLSQTLPAYEILVVDDGSTDGTAEVAASFGSPVRVIRQANAGPGAARNRGIQESKGEYLHFFDSDDIAVRNKHEVQLSALEETGADIAYGPWVKGIIEKETFHPETWVMQQNGLPAGSLVKALLCEWSTVPHACLFRRSIVERAGGFPEDLRIAEDQLMFLNCLLQGAKVVHTPGTVELYRSNNADKLTANTDASRRRVVDWAKFLWRAGEGVAAVGEQTLAWASFRRRYWQAIRDLRGFSDSEAVDLADQMEEALGIHRLYSVAYQIKRWFDQKRDGFQERLVGHRHNQSFRVGRLSSAQEGLISESGFRIV